MTNENITNETNDVQGFFGALMPANPNFLPSVRVGTPQLGGFNATLGRPMNLREFQVQQGAVERGERLQIMGDYNAMR